MSIKEASLYWLSLRLKNMSFTIAGYDSAKCARYFRGFTRCFQCITITYEAT